MRWKTIETKSEGIVACQKEKTTKRRKVVEPELA